MTDSRLIATADVRPLILDRVFGAPCRFSVIGDSISCDFANGQGITATNNWCYLTWFRRFMGRRIDLTSDRNYAVAGSLVSDAVGDQLPLATADDSSVCIVQIGTNSVGVENDDVLQSEMQEIFDSLRAAGKTVIAIPIRARNGANPWGDSSASVKLKLWQLNRFIYQYCRNNDNMLYFNFDPYIIDWTTGDAQSIYLRDGIHDNVISAKLLGKAMADWLSPLLPVQDGGLTSPYDLYDASLNPTGELSGNGLMLGTGGTVINGATGTSPNGYRSYRTPTGGTVTAAWAAVADGTYATMKRQKCTIGGTGDGTSIILDTTQVALADWNVNIGDTLELEAEISWSFTSGEFSALFMELDFDDANFVTLAYASEGTASSDNGAFAVGDSGTAFFRTPPVVAPVGAVNVGFAITLIAPFSGACAGTLTIGRIALRKVL